jgi:2-methylcitrate dehydratase PrpD
MSVLETAAEFVVDRRLSQLPGARQNLIKQHVLDTLGALVAGSALEDGAVLRSLSPFAPLATTVAAARCTEIDDVHLSSCTTPGSVIVPTALHLASNGQLGSWPEFSAAVLAGYELLIRLGFAIDGSMVLGKQIWPTSFAAAFGAAAVASRALGLNAAQTAGALGTALAFCTGTPSAPSSGGSSRYLSLGVAAANGVIAAQGAGHGLMGSAQLLERNGGRIAGVEISEIRLLDELGDGFLFDDIGMKPYPVARQALAAIEAVRELVITKKIDTGSISEIVIGVPAAQVKVIDHREWPTSRIGAIASVQYQVAMAVCCGDQVRDLMARVRVEHAPELEKYYPNAWPGQAEIRTRSERFSKTVIYPIGDAKNRCTPAAVEEKFRRLAAPQLGVEAAENLINEIRRETPPALWSTQLAPRRHLQDAEK